MPAGEAAMTLGEASRQFQCALEHVRRATDEGTDEEDDAVALLEADKALVAAWVEQVWLT